MAFFIGWIILLNATVVPEARLPAQQMGSLAQQQAVEGQLVPRLVPEPQQVPAE